MKYNIEITDEDILVFLSSFLLKDQDFNGYLYGKALIADQNFEFEFENTKIKYIFVLKYHKPLATNSSIKYHKQYFLEFETSNIDLLIKSIKKASYGYSTRHTKNITVSIITEKNKHYTELPKRELSTIFIPNKDLLIKDLLKFKSSKKKYREHGILYARNYLLEGPPGSGKTSLILSLATLLNIPVCLVNLTKDFKDDSLIDIFTSNNYGYKIFVFEDLDRLFEKEHSLTLSTILNVLDGLMRPDKSIVFITINKKDLLPPVLLRAGRIDFTFKFQNTLKEQIIESYNKYFPNSKKIDGFLPLIKKEKFTFSIWQKYLFELESEPENLDGFFKLLEEYKKEEFSLYT